MTHYHVSIHSEDDDVYITDDLFAALDYAAQELDRAADFEHDGVSAVAAKVEDARSWGKKYPDVYEMEEALLSFAKCERYANLMLNARNMVKQHNADTDDRAPLYSADPYAGLGDDHPNSRLRDAALRTAREINEGSPLGIWDCAASLLTWPDNDPMHGGESYCADEYPDGYAGYQDGPCGDH